MNLETNSFTSLTKTFIKTLNKHIPTKKKYVRANHTNFVVKDLRKTIMLRSRLWNIFLKEKYSESRKTYHKPHNICCSMVKKLRKNTFKTLTYQILLTARSFGQL